MNKSLNINTLADLPVGKCGKVIKINSHFNGRKKFADIGLVPGTELSMEGHAPFGGLLRIKLLGSSMAVHRRDAGDIIMETEC